MLNIKDIENAIKNSTSFRQASDILGIKNGHIKIKKLAIQNSICFEHFTHRKIYKSMIGKKFGELEVLRVFQTISKNGKNRGMAECKCSCGKIKITRCDSIKSGRVVSCGQKGHDRFNISGYKNPSFKGVGDLGACRFKDYERSAKRRNIKFAITIDDLWNKFLEQNKKCKYTGLPLYFGRNNRPHETNASLDRIDSCNGYTPENIQWVLKEINIMKGILQEKTFLELCNLVSLNGVNNE